MYSSNARLCDPVQDFNEIVELFYTVKDSLHLSNRMAISEVVDVVFTHGGFVGTYHQGRLVAVAGFFRGDPSDNFASPNIGFIYVAAILPEYQQTTVFLKGTIRLLTILHDLGMNEIRMQASVTDTYTNRLYSRFARLLGQGTTLRGKPVNTYGGSTATALVYLNRIAGRRRMAPSTMAATSAGTAF